MKHRLLTAFYDTPWAIIPDRLPVIRSVLHRWASGIKLSAEEIEAAIGTAPEAAQERRQRAAGSRGIGIIPILGVMAQRTAGSISSPGTATDTVRRQLDAMLNDDRVDAILLDVDSPGGSVFGVRELADDIFAARGRKKIVAHANSLAASAAYWVASAADEFVVSPGGEVGSIGVIAAHEDMSEQLAQEGVKVTLITAGKHKGEGHPFGPLSEEDRESIQARVNSHYDAFVTAVARHRGVSVAEVRDGFGEGRSVLAKEAHAQNMVDRIEPFSATLTRLQTGQRALTPNRRAGMARRQIAIAELQRRRFYLQELAHGNHR